MSRGKKNGLANVMAFPSHDEPQAVHFARAKDLRPRGMLSKDELKVWDRAAPNLVMLGRLKTHYVDAFSEYCRIVCRLSKARKYLDEKEWSFVTTGRHGTQEKSRPEVAQLNDDWRKWRSLVGEFGLAPASDKGLSSNQSDIFDSFDDF